MTKTLTVEQSASDAAQAKALFSVPPSHGRFCFRPSAGREFTEIFILIQTLRFITVQFRDDAVVSVNSKLTMFPYKVLNLTCAENWNIT